MRLEYTVEGGNFSKAGYVSSEVKKILKQLNADSLLIKKVVVSLFEAEVNIVAHAYSGIIIIDIDTSQIFTQLIDKGPGIENIDKAMENGFSTASEKVREMGFGAGMGLSNIKKNSDEFNIVSELNKGTTLTIIHHIK